MAFYYLRKTLALLLLVVPAALMGYVGTTSLFHHMPAMLVVAISPFFVANLLALVGLALGKAWGRWLALAGACAGLTLIGAKLGSQPGVDAVTVAYGAYCAAVLACLMGRRMERRHRGPLTGCHGRSRWLSWGTVLCLAALPMLWFVSLAPSSQAASAASALAVLLVIAGTVALVCQRTAGVLLLGAAAVITAASTTWTLLMLTLSPFRFGLLAAGGDLLDLQLLALGLILPGVALLWGATARPMWRYLKKSC